MGIVALATVVGALASPARAQTANDDLAAKQRQQQEVRKQKADAAGRLDVLQANDDQVKGALQALHDDVTDQRRALAAAEERSATAQQAAADAKALEAKKQDEVGQAATSVRTLALRAYVGGDTGASIDSVVSAGSGSEAVVRTVLGSLRSSQMVDALDALESAQQDLAAARKAADRASKRAGDRLADAQSQLTSLQQAQVRQQALATRVESRLESTLAEVASLSRLDATLAGQIAGQQAVIAAQLKQAREEAAAQAAARAAATQTAAATAPGTARPTQPPPPSPGNVPAPPRTGSGGGGNQPAPYAISPAGTGRGPNGTFQLVEVAGITVAASLGDDLARMLPAAQAAGYRLGGGGYRSSDAQIAMRESNCGTSDYAIWDMPASECDPPTARPGASMHELGLAIDFVCNGALVNSRSSGCYQWLARNAARYGLYNLPSEPWHWSVNGN